MKRMLCMLLVLVLLLAACRTTVSDSNVPLGDVDALDLSVDDPVGQNGDGDDLDGEMPEEEEELPGVLLVTEAQYIMADAGETPSIQVAVTAYNDYADIEIEARAVHSFVDGVQQDLAEELDWGNLPDDCLVQVTAIDLDQDDVKEILVSAGDQKTGMQTAIYRFLGQEGQAFEHVGTIEGERYMEIEKRRILAPYGSAGDFEKYRYDKGKLYIYQDEKLVRI